MKARGGAFFSIAMIEELMAETGTRNELTRATHDRFKLAGERYGLGAGEMTVCKVIEDDGITVTQLIYTGAPPFWRLS